MAVPGATTSAQVERLAANLLKLGRAKAGMSQRELAETAEVGQYTTARIESQTRQPSLPVLAKILAALNLQIRITLADYDSHDDALNAHDARLSAEQRARRHAAQDHFAAARARHTGR